MSKDWQNIYLRLIPSVESILSHEKTMDRFYTYPRWALLEGIRKVLEQKRVWILSCTESEELSQFQGGLDPLLDEIDLYLQKVHSQELSKVINATGIILHTNLGRAILAHEVVERVKKIAGHYSNLEFDLLTGKRGKRGDYCLYLLSQITGAEDALVVNNNAAAVLLVLNTLAESREVIVSRGELVEIGGSFRIPEIMKKGGAKLVEVGTTNKTRLEDYQRAITEETVAILKVHPSNFRIMGFTEDVSLSELVQLGQSRGVAVIYDLGSGVLVDLSAYGLEEPVVAQAVQQGADIVTFSGDKLLGGPQAGIILSKQKFRQALRKNPLSRALRPDKITLACLENTLKLYQEPDLWTKIPTLRMITDSIERLKERGKRILEGLSGSQQPGIHLELIDDAAEVGGGAFPMQQIPSLALAISLTGSGLNQLEEQFRLWHPPILGRIHRNRFLLNLRTIQDDEISEIVQATRQILQI